MTPPWKRPGLLPSVARDSAIALVIQVSGIGLGYLSHILLARWMAPAEYGSYAHALAWVAILSTLAGLGLPNAVLRFIPEYQAHSDPSRLRGILRGSFRLTLAATLLLSAVSFVLILALNAHSRRHAFAPLMLGVWTVPLYTLMQLQAHMLRAVRRMVWSQGPAILMQRILVLIGAFLLFRNYRELSSTGVIGIWMLTLALVLIVQRFLIARDDVLGARDVQPIDETRAWLRVSIPLLLIVGAQISLERTDLVVIGAVSGLREVGIYNAAARTAQLVNLVFSMALLAAAPALVSLYARGQHDELQRLASAIAHWSFWPALGCASILMLFANSILAVFGPQFPSGQCALALLLCGQLINVGTGAAGTLLNLTGHQHLSFRVYLAVAIINLVLNFIAVPLWGITGAAAATALSVCVLNLTLQHLTVRHLGIRPSIAFALRDSARRRAGI